VVSLHVEVSLSSVQVFPTIPYLLVYSSYQVSHISSTITSMYTSIVDHLPVMFLKYVPLGISLLVYRYFGLFWVLVPLILGICAS